MTCRAACCQSNYDRGLADAVPRVILSHGVSPEMGEVHVIGAGGMMSVYAGAVADARRMADSLAHTLAATLESRLS